jgi:hypothetical protein
MILNVQDIDKLRKHYREMCFGYGKHLEQCDDADITNAYADEVLKAFRDLMRRGSPGIEAVMSLINDPEAYVRHIAAIFGLQFQPEECVKVLEELQSFGQVTAFTVTMGLERWRSGELTFPMIEEDRFGTLEEVRQERERLGIHYEPRA